MQELLRTIVSADLPRIKKEIDSCIAASFHCDASKDQTQKDNEYMLLNMIKKDGKQDLKFIGIGHVTEPDAADHLQALKTGASDTVGFDKVLKVGSHLSTDGEAKKTGQYNGLWKLLDDEREKLDVKNFASAKRTTDLEKVGAKDGLTVRRIPKYFEVRWSEFTAALLDAILCSWQALAKFCEEQHDTEGNKFLKLLTNKDNTLRMCFVADLLFLLKVFQKKLQSDSLIIVDIESEAEKFQKSLDKLGTRSLLGGWEEPFEKKV